MYIWVSTERPQCCCCGRFLGWWNKNPTCGECHYAAYQHWRKWSMEQQMLDPWQEWYDAWHEDYEMNMHDKTTVMPKKPKKRAKRWVPKHLQ